MERLIKQMNRATEATELIHEMLTEYDSLLYEYRRETEYDKEKEFTERKERLLKDLLQEKIHKHFDWNRFTYSVDLDEEGNPKVSKEIWIEQVKKADPTLGLGVDYMTGSEIMKLAGDILEEEYEIAVERARDVE